jgi:hypothetical protein
MANIQPQYGTATTLTSPSLATLANGSSTVSSLIGNTLYLDYIFTISITTGSGALATGIVECYAQGSSDGSLFDDASNDKWIGSIVLSAAGAQTRMRTMTIASSFGGTVPPQFQLRFKNSTGASLTAASIRYVGVNAKTV